MGTYKDFLEMLGISHGIFMVILIIAFLILSLIMLLYKLGFLTRIKFKQVILPEGKIVYTKFEDRYDIINSKVQEVFEETKTFFKLSNIFGIYYDPDEEVDPNKMRAVLGVMVHDAESHRVPEFIRKLGGKYKQGQIPQTKCVGTRYPYFNSASLIMIINRVYPRLAEWVRTKKLDVGPGVIEIYHLMASSPYVQIMTPTQNHKQFLFV